MTSPSAPVKTERILSIDALRGLVMFAMIFVNDLAGASEKIVPDWMRHFHGKSGMTFVDLVFPAFLFISGMSIPSAIEARFKRREPLWKIAGHVILRTLSLLMIGILMVNETPQTTTVGFSGDLWCTLMYFFSILTFCNLKPPQANASENTQKLFSRISLILRTLGLVSLIWLATIFRGSDGHAVLSLNPLSLHMEWFGILGLIAWAYLVAALCFLIFRNNLTALLGCMVLSMCLYPAEKHGLFNHVWISRYVDIGSMLGSLASITVAGTLLGSMVANRDLQSAPSRVRFTAWFIAACAAGAVLLHGLYGINKNEATPSWCLWACAITTLVWLAFYYTCDLRKIREISAPACAAGQNVLLAYLISEMLPSLLENLHLGDFYGALATPHLANAIARSAGCGLVILSLTVLLNRIGFRLKL